VRGHAEDARDLVDLELARLEELSLLGRDRDRRVLHPLLEDGDLVRVRRAAELPLPGVAQPRGVFHGPRMLQHPAGGGPVGEELGPVLLAGDRHADGVLGHRDWRVAHQAVESQAGYVEHFGGVEHHRGALHRRCVLGAGGVPVVEPAARVAVDLHPVGHQRVEGCHLALAVADDLRIGVAPEQQVGHERLAEHEAGHLRIGLGMQQGIERMVLRLLFARVLPVAVQVQRQSRDRLGKDAHAGVHRRHLHRGALVDRLAACRAPEKEAVRGSAGPVLGLVASPRDELGYESHAVCLLIVR